MAISCPCGIEDELQTSCSDRIGVGGLLPTVYIANLCDIESVIKNSPGAEYVNEITMKQITAGPPAVYARFWRFDNVEFGNGANTTLNVGDNLNWSQSITLKLRGMKQEYIDLIENMATGRYAVLVQSRIMNNAIAPTSAEQRLFLYGWANGLTVTAQDSPMGPGADVLTGFNITLSGFETNMHFEVRPDPLIYTTSTPIAEFLAKKIDPTNN